MPPSPATSPSMSDRSAAALIDTDALIDLGGVLAPDALPDVALYLGCR